MTNPSGTEVVEVSDCFVAKDGDLWYIIQNVDYEDAEGYMGMTIEYLGNVHGYETQEAAELALAKLFQGN